MNCNDSATIMIQRGESRLTASERAALEQHVAACEACSCARQAGTALAAWQIPRTPRHLLANVIAVLHEPPARARHRASTRLAVAGAFLAAGAALAALVTVGGFGGWRRAETTNVAAPQRTRDTSQTDPQPTLSPEIGSAGDARAQDAPVLDIAEFLIARVPPIYPPKALARGLDGSVEVKYTIGRNGAVQDAVAVTSSDALFEQAAVGAVSLWRYLPRIAGGQRVAVPDIRTVIRFQITGEPRGQVIPQRSDESQQNARRRAYEEFTTAVERAWRKVADEDLRGAELELDEVRASFELEARQQATAQSFYGYLFTQYGDHGRAIAAYEAAIAIQEQGPSFGGWVGDWVALANLYFARNQYDMAFKTLLRYKKWNAGSASYPGTDQMIEKLRTLGVTPETL